jgi:glucose-1-phosphate thymidylyltransferase
MMLAGGAGSRLFPLSRVSSKQLQPVYDKPMIYYPISILMSAGIKEILIITTPEDSSSFQKLLGNGKQFGCEFTYAIQEVPNGLAQAFVIGEEFIGDDSVALILGDNIFYGTGLDALLMENTDTSGGVVFALLKFLNQGFEKFEFDGNQKLDQKCPFL